MFTKISSLRTSSLITHFWTSIEQRLEPHQKRDSNSMCVRCERSIKYQDHLMEDHMSAVRLRKSAFFKSSTVFCMVDWFLSSTIFLSLSVWKNRAWEQLVNKDPEAFSLYYWANPSPPYSQERLPVLSVF